jgi:hypothetical protein
MLRNRPGLTEKEFNSHTHPWHGAYVVGLSSADIRFYRGDAEYFDTLSSADARRFKSLAEVRAWWNAVVIPPETWSPKHGVVTVYTIRKCSDGNCLDFFLEEIETLSE